MRRHPSDLRRSRNGTCPACRAKVTGTQDSHIANNLLELYSSISGNAGNEKTEEEKKELDEIYKPGTRVRQAVGFGVLLKFTGDLTLGFWNGWQINISNQDFNDFGFEDEAAFEDGDEGDDEEDFIDDELVNAPLDLPWL